MLEPRGLYRFDGKSRPDDGNMIPWEMGKQPVWDVMVVDPLAPSRIKARYATRKPPPPRLRRVKLRRSKYREMKDNGYTSQPMSLAVQSSLAESSEVFITRLWKTLWCSHDDQ